MPRRPPPRNRSPTLQLLRQFIRAKEHEAEALSKLEVSRRMLQQANVYQKERREALHLEASLEHTDAESRLNSIAEQLVYKRFIAVETEEDIDAVVFLRRRYTFLGRLKIKRSQNWRGLTNLARLNGIGFRVMN